MDLKTVVRPFYEECLTVKPGGDPGRVATIMSELLAPDFKSLNSTETKTRDQLIKQVQYFWVLVPDLKWTIEEMIHEGNRVVVRSTATGTPKGDFMGFPADGTRSFRIMTMDLHLVTGKQISQVHHLEEWTAAMKQLKGG